MERILRWREPAVLVVTGALVLRVALALVVAATSARLGLGSPGDSAGLAGRQLAEPVIFVVLAALVLCCHRRPATPHARALTGLALVVAGLTLVLAVVLIVSGAAASRSSVGRLNLAGGLVDLVLPLLAVGTLAVLLGRPQPAPETRPALPPVDEVAVTPAAEPQPDPELQPTWHPDTAAGAAWYTADDAASGRPAAGWAARPAPAAGSRRPGCRWHRGSPLMRDRRRTGPHLSSGMSGALSRVRGPAAGASTIRSALDEPVLTGM